MQVSCSVTSRPCGYVPTGMVWREPRKIEDLLQVMVATKRHSSSHVHNTQLIAAIESRSKYGQSLYEPRLTQDSASYAPPLASLAIDRYHTTLAIAQTAT